MKIYDHWAKAAQKAVGPEGNKFWLVGWAGSNTSVEDAHNSAINRIADIENKLSTNGWLESSYGYDNDNPIKEIVIERFGDTNSPYAAITRNRYGALVLNAAHVFIADVDLPTTEMLNQTTPQNGLSGQNHSTKKVGFFKRLFGGGSKAGSADQPANEPGISSAQNEQLIKEQRENAMVKFAEFHHQFPALSFRIYATAAGFRVIVTNEIVEPGSAESEKWMEALDADTLYRKLCQKQHCYRARLTPKPWRLPSCKSPVFFPNGQHADEYQLDQWITDYERKSSGYAVCALVASHGDGMVNDEVAQVLAVHDEYVLNDTATQLA